jgi:NADH-quinone oxidoreductase subunit E
MVQINDDYYEDLTPETLSQILGKLKNGVEVAPGPQIDRVNSAPEGGATTLTDPSLFDGSRNSVATLPNLPSAEPAEAEAAGKPEAAAPTNTKREEPVASNTKTTLIDTGKKVETGERPAAVTIDPASYDDLKRIKGIGPKNEDALNELGIYTFKQIAEWTPENVDWVEDFMSFPGRIEREDWIAQAKTLAEGGETEFSKRVDAGDVPSSQEDED